MELWRCGIGSGCGSCDEVLVGEYYALMFVSGESVFSLSDLLHMGIPIQLTPWAELQALIKKSQKCHIYSLPTRSATWRIRLSLPVGRSTAARCVAQICMDRLVCVSQVDRVYTTRRTWALQEHPTRVQLSKSCQDIAQAIAERAEGCPKEAVTFLRQSN